MPSDIAADIGLVRHNFLIGDAPANAPVKPEINIADAPWQKELMVHFLRNQLRAAPAMPLLAVLLATISSLWVPATTVMMWFIFSLICQMAQLYLCNRYFSDDRKSTTQGEWIGIISASELLQGVCWILPLFLFWPQDSAIYGVILIASIMAVISVRLLVVNCFMPILIAGTGVMTLGIAVRCIMSGDTAYIALAGLVIALEFFYLFIARQLHETARDMVTFKLQKDDLIAQLEKARDKAEDARTVAEDANKAKSVFLANMSHELRTPLNAIMGFSEILEGEMLGPMENPTYKDYAGDIHDSGQYLLALINDILDLSRIETGRLEMANEPFSLVDQVSEAMRLLKDRAATRKIAIAQIFSANTPKIMGDGRAAYQIAINLISNAIKFTPSGGQIILKIDRNAQGGIRFIVKDNGPGIPAHEIELAMSAFSRGSLATKKAIDGAGLGLPIVKGLIELHGGTLEIKSELGHGTEVISTFPAKRILAGPRGEVIAAPTVLSESQRKLITLTG
jgi:two-component system, cell cycle sensor histidine kinase PleC